MKIAVLGAGRVGSIIALDLARNHNVTSIDSDQTKLQALKERNPAITVDVKELRNVKAYGTWIGEYDLVVSAVPGYMGYATLEAIIKAGKNVVDISFFPEDPFPLHGLASIKDVTAVVDCGVAPGLSNMIAGHVSTKVFYMNNFTCYVGGLPKVRTKPFEYKAPFSPIDVIEEYTRPSRLVEDRRVVVRPALSDVEQIEAPGIGTLEAFNTDGLRTLLTTMSHVANMKEKTLRYPGHADMIKFLFNTGLLNGNLDILFEKWQLGPDDEDFTYMKIITEGLYKGEHVKRTYTVYDQYDKENKIHSMSRTTGYTCTAVVNAIADSILDRKGIVPPEDIGSHSESFDYVIDYLKSRNVIIDIQNED